MIAIASAARALAAGALLACVSTCAATPALADQIGRASYYGYESGRVTASGERFNPLGLTAAHRSLPFGTRLRVTDTQTGRSVVVRVTDRGPFVAGRILDLSLGAARALGITGRGVATVRIAAP